MNPFKDHFLGKVKLTFTKATSCQKCLRTGDIENVGRTAYHHTFFEMLGNFSFGDYFKREAINWAWEFLTSKKWLGIPGERLTVTVYLDDDEAAGIWQKDIGLPTSRIERMGEDDNFWPASAPSKGPDGVCGPCSEIYYHPEGSGKSVEIWNLVFTQFNRVGDPPNNLRPLPSKNIDTGMGLERCAATLQGVDTNFHIDSLRPLVEAAAEAVKQKYEPNSENGRRIRRIADHVRACTMAIHENVTPGPAKEKYVIRRLLRRSVLEGYQMGLRDPFLHQLVPMVAQMMKVPYPELTETTARVARTIEQEERGFFGTIEGGLSRVEKLFGEMQREGKAIVDGRAAFDLYQTYGLPPEITESLGAEKNFAFDWHSFKKAADEHGSGGNVGVLFQTGAIEGFKRAFKLTEFLAYQATETTAEVRGIAAHDEPVDSIVEIGHEDPIAVVLDRSPFYGESGGQVGDTGTLTAPGVKFHVIDTQKSGDLLVHLGHLIEGKLIAGAKVTAHVNTARRDGIRRAHSATHLLHHGLHQVIGNDANQQGSKVDEDWLRFDFSHGAPVSAEELSRIEQIVADLVAKKAPVDARVVPLAEARKAGAMMLFGEKYPDPARMVSMGDFSRELCGGTHLSNTGDVGAFELISEEGVSAGVRRIVALTGKKAEDHIKKTKETLAEIAKALHVLPADAVVATRSLAQLVRDLKKQASGSGKATDSPTLASSKPGEMPYAQVKQSLREIARLVNVGPFDAPARIAAMQAEATALRQQIANLAQAGALTAEALLAGATDRGGAKIIVAEAPGANPNIMRQLIDQVRKSVSPSAVLLASVQDGKVVLVAGVSRDLVDKGVHAGQWVGAAAQACGGSGGGKPDMAQAGGKQPEKLAEALQAAREKIEGMMG